MTRLRLLAVEEEEEEGEEYLVNNMEVEVAATDTFYWCSVHRSRGHPCCPSLKHNNTMADLGEQIDSLSANKVKSEKDKVNTELDLRDARCDLEDAVKGKADLDKTGKLLQGNIVDANTRLDEMARALNEAESSKKRLQVENQDLSRQIDELEAAIANMNKGKIFVPSWSLDRSSRRSTGAWPRRRRSSTTPGRTTLVPWSPCLPLLRPSRGPKVRP